MHRLTKTNFVLAGSLVRGFVVVAALGLAACSGAEESEAEVHAGEAALEGELVVYAATSLDGRTSRSYALRRQGLGPVTLELDAAPPFATGTPLRVIGSFTAEHTFRVARYDVVKPSGEVGVSRQAIAQPTQTRSFALLLLHFGTPLPGVTPASLEQTLFGQSTPTPSEQSSMSQYYREVSFGARDFQGDVFDWIQIAPQAPCDVNAAQTAGLAAAAAANIDLSQYDHVGFLLPVFCSDFAALAEVGFPQNPGRFSWYYSSTDMGIFAHELGHNLGFPHANGWDCGTATIATADQCVSRDHLDPLDNMGFVTRAHVNSYFKTSQGWLAGCNVVTATSNGEFLVRPLEVPTTELQALRIPVHPSLCPADTNPCFYYVENRERIGFDGFSGNSFSALHDGALIRLGGVGNPAQAIQNSHLLTFTPATPNVPFPIFGAAAFPVGETFEDPTGVRITTLSDDAQGLRVQVEIPGGTGAPTCLGNASPSLPTSISFMSNWETGYCAEIRIQNNRSTVISNWSLRLNVGNSSLYTSWLAQFTNFGNSLYDVTPFSWNNSIQPGQFATANFCANKTGPNFTPVVLSATAP